MADLKAIRLKHSEINHLLVLIESREQEGWYFGNKSFFEKREQTIKNKLITAANTMPKERGK